MDFLTLKDKEMQVQRDQAMPQGASLMQSALLLIYLHIWGVSYRETLSETFQTSAVPLCTGFGGIHLPFLFSGTKEARRGLAVRARFGCLM